MSETAKTTPKASDVASQAKDEKGAGVVSTPSGSGSVSVPDTGKLVESAKRKYTRRPKETAEAPSTVQPLDAASQLNLELLKKSAYAITGATDSFICRRLYVKALPVYKFLDEPTAEEQAKGLALSVALTKGELEIVSESIAVVGQQYPSFLRWSPILALAGVGASYSIRMFAAFNTLDQKIAEVKKLREASK